MSFCQTCAMLKRMQRLATLERSENMMSCHACSKGMDIRIRPVGRRDVCAFCGSDLHCCLNCRFYQIGSYNDCREPQAERVIDKDRNNFCDYFSFRDVVSSGKDEKNAGSAAKGKLESLFKSG
jgi:hypothetical protein